MRRILWILVALAVVGSVGLAFDRAHQGILPSTQNATVSLDQQSPFVGRQPPGLNLTDLDGHPVSADQLKGRPVLLNFWATWCIPCKAEMPELQHEANLLGGSVAIVGVDDGEDAATIRGFVSEIGVTYRIWRDPSSQVDSLLKAPGLPFSLFLDRVGNIRRIHLGQMDRGYIDARLHELLRG